MRILHRFFPITTIAIFILVFISFFDSESIEKKYHVHAGNTSLVQEKNVPTIEKEITLSAVGDVLIHSPVYEDARVGDGFDFNPMFKHVKTYLDSSTVTIANQETMIGGEAIGLSSYPSFNSPFEVGDALKENGVDIVTLANNHTLDRGERAITNAIGHWQTIDMLYEGAYQSKEDQEKIRVLETEEGITIASLAYTYGTNGIPVPHGKEYLVNLIDREKMQKDIIEAKKIADVIVLSLHFGNEYEPYPNQSQKDLAKFAADLGVDVIIGHHPHVLQPIDWVEGKDGHQTLVAYSLGNFLSNQQKYDQRVGGIFGFSITKQIKGDEEKVEVHSPTFVPTYVHFENDYTNYRVIPMFQLSDDQLNNAQEKYEDTKQHINQFIDEVDFLEK
ncbi:CapA family protein [Oceanobacillus sp. 1P07AA]|uniref:CapA family protein n=1 Tax=Oceanobacillus sp. 1P07AA TaxID=3132293 RepID=UPI0039A577AE